MDSNLSSNFSANISKVLTPLFITLTSAVKPELSNLENITFLECNRGDRILTLRKKIINIKYAANNIEKTLFNIKNNISLTNSYNPDDIQNVQTFQFFTNITNDNRNAITVIQNLEMLLEESRKKLIDLDNLVKECFDSILDFNSIPVGELTKLTNLSEDSTNNVESLIFKETIVSKSNETIYAEVYKTSGYLVGTTYRGIGKDTNQQPRYSTAPSFCTTPDLIVDEIRFKV